MNNPIFVPSGNQHLRLKKVANGGEHINVSIENLGTLYQDDDLEEVARECYDTLICGLKEFSPYIVIEEPKPHEDHWIIQKFLTPVGQKAMAALDVGWFWNATAQEEDIEKTFDFYRDLMAKGKFTATHADWIVGNTDERFRPLRNEVVYFKLTAKRVGDNFIKMDKSNE